MLLSVSSPAGEDLVSSVYFLSLYSEVAFNPILASEGMTSFLIGYYRFGIPATRSPPIPDASSGITKTALMFHSLQEELGELTESWYAHSYGLLRQRDAD